MYVCMYMLMILELRVVIAVSTRGVVSSFEKDTASKVVVGGKHISTC